MIASTSGLDAPPAKADTTRQAWSKALQLTPDLYPGVGGKRFRANLVQRAYEFAGGRGVAPSKVVDAIEMLHAGSLVVDDFQDDSHTRRGQPALHRVIGPARAINAGNWMYFEALDLAGNAYREPVKKTELLAKFIAVSRACHEGQAIDLSTRVDEVTPRQAYATALAISRWKTGRLVSLAAWCGAHAAGGDPATLRAAAAFGCRVGVCLQMKNDLDELIDLAAGSGRSDDLRNRRVTWPWAWAATQLPPHRFAQLQQRSRESNAGLGGFRSLADHLAAASVMCGRAAINERLDRAARRVSAVADRRRSGPLAAVTGALRCDRGTRDRQNQRHAGAAPQTTEAAL